jgi:hypothetical protein
MLTLNTYADRNTLQCWPSIPQLAERSRLDQKTVRDSIARLEKAGMVSVERRDRKASILTLRVPTTPETASSKNGSTPENATSGFPLNYPRKREETTPENGRLTSKDQEQDHVVQTPDMYFEEFWKSYPKRASRKRAEEKFMHAVKVTDPQLIIDGAKRYASTVENTASRYIKNADGWLADERWAERFDDQVANESRAPVVPDVDSQWLRALKIPAEEYVERKDEPGWVESMRVLAADVGRDEGVA